MHDKKKLIDTYVMSLSSFEMLSWYVHVLPCSYPYFIASSRGNYGSNSEREAFQ